MCVQAALTALQLCTSCWARGDTLCNVSSGVSLHASMPSPVLCRPAEPAFTCPSAAPLCVCAVYPQKEKEASGLADVPGGAKGKLLEVEYAFTEDKKLRGQLRDPSSIESQVSSGGGAQAPSVPCTWQKASCSCCSLHTAVTGHLALLAGTSLKA